MDLSLNDDERLLVESASRWATDYYTWNRRTESVAAGGCASGTWRNLADLGWLALAAPEEAGGLGLSLHHMVLLISALGRGLVVEPLVTSAVISTKLLSLCTTIRAADLLREMVDGTKIVALAAVERGAIGEPGAKAVSSPDGVVTVNGSMLLVVDGQSADAFVLAAPLDGAKAASLFLVPRDAAGLSVSSYALIDGRGAADLKLDNVELGADALLLPSPGAHDAVEQALDWGIAANLGEVIGVMEACLEHSVNHLKERKQFGQPLAKFQALQHLAAEMFVEATQARSMLYYLLSQLGTPTQALAISECKLLIGEAGVRLMQRAMQIHGAIAFTEEFYIGQYYKRVLTTVGLYGNEDFHHRRVTMLEAQKHTAKTDV